MLRTSLVCLIASSVFASIQTSEISDVNNEIERAEHAVLNETESEKDRCIVLETKATLCEEEVRLDSTVSQGTVCIFRDQVSKTPQYLVCNDGNWAESVAESVLTHIREKRNHEVCVISRTRTRRWWQRRRRITTTCWKPNHPPYFVSCPSTLTFSTPSKATSVQARWSTPWAYDVEDGYLRVIQTSGPRSGQTLQGSETGTTYNVYYSAVDSSGERTTCKTRITVRVVYCPSPSFPKNGALSCRGGHNYGQTCTVNCLSGYTPTVTSIYCQQNGKWTDTGKCIGSSCTKTLPSISNGHYTCRSYSYGQTCYPTCDPGYSAILIPIVCKSDRTWTSPTGQVCRDSDPPTFVSCPSDIVEKADLGSTSSVVSWQVPTATDQQDSNPPQVKQTVGSITPNSRIKEGIHTVAYVAFDTAGNPSTECSFTVEVKVTRCAALTAPSKGQYSCNKRFIYGSQCSFSCNTGFLLHGSGEATCQSDGTWSTMIPKCKVIKCQPPDQYGLAFSNGHYDCPATITYQTACRAVCDTGFQLEQYSAATCTVDADSNTRYSVSTDPKCVDAEPPVFPNCVGTKVITLQAIKGTRSATVQYTMPETTDNVDTTPTVEKISGPDVGDTVWDQNITYVEFRATDNAGNRSPRCTYALQVQVKECDVYVPPSNGVLTCSVDNVYGSVCTLTCDDGYLSGSSASSECLQTGQWSTLDLRCQLKLCSSAPVDPRNGYYTCPSQTYSYNTICFAGCNPGFTLQQPSFIRCSAQQIWESSTSASCIDSQPPVFTNCETELTFTADRTTTSTNVTWNVPTAIDNVDVSPTVVKLSGPDPGTVIEGEVTVKYQATDQAGNPSDTCTMDITVDVIQCNSPQWPDFGKVTCDFGNLYGSNCSYTCMEGYTVSQPSFAVCEQDKTWSYGNQPPYCTEISCGIPDASANGSWMCFGSSYSFGSVCTLECTSGFSIEHTVYISCRADGKWFSPSATVCRDSTPPTLVNCKSYQTFYADRETRTANASWTLPSATDNVDQPADIAIEQVSGPSLGSALPVGSTVVEYRARDKAGNPSVTTCSVTVNVEAIYCTHPNSSFNDTDLVYTCPSLQWGDSCTLTCPLAKSLKLTGPEVISCEVNFLGNSHSTFWQYDGNAQPFCEAETCPKNLSEPQNGALTYTNDRQPVVFVLCNENFDLSYQFSGQIFCLDSGLWKPSTVPDCTRSRRPGLNLLPAEYYYSGNCTSEVDANAIKDKVFQLLEAFRDTVYAPDCFADSSCGYEDLIVSCGASGKRKRSVYDPVYEFIRRIRRQSASIRVQFVLTLNGEVNTYDDLQAYEKQLFNISDSLKTAIYNGDLKIPEFQVVQDSYTQANVSYVKCNGTGQVVEGLLCKSCPRGTYLGDENGTKKCIDCPVGTYMDHDAASSCYACPEGTSTNATGSKSADMCVAHCPVGQVSPTNVLPCTPCAKGQFQDSPGQTTCDICGAGQTTFQTGSTNCSYYDLIFSGQMSLIAYTADIDWTEFSVALWVLMDGDSSVNISFGNAFGISLQKGPSYGVVSVGGTSSLIAWPNNWIHMAITGSMSASMYSVYVSGEVAVDGSALSSGTIPAGTAVEISYRASSDIRVSSFMLLGTALAASEVAAMSASCLLATPAVSGLSSDDLIAAVPDLDADPSTCVATDACAIEPCGPHLCTPTISGFVCTCYGGFSGTTCQIAPDNCYDNQCENSATCVSNDGNYTCSCLPGYRGSFCQFPPVDGGWGTWTPWGGCSVSCDGGVRNRTRPCDSPTPTEFGKACDGPSEEETSCNTVSCATLDLCETSPCGDHQCTPSVNGYKCSCSKGFTGTMCDTVVDNCHPNPCRNGGSCVNGVGNFTCVCPENFSGELCEQEAVRTCYWTVWSPCSATCNGGISNRTYVCVLGNGTRAEEYLTRPCNSNPCSADPCLLSPCGDNSTCVPDGEDYSCICETGKTGSTCDADIDFCVNNLCERGNCSNTGPGYQCICEQGYSGDFCNVKPADGGWGEWSELSICSVSCGTGTLSRSRLCDNPPPTTGGKPCEGPNEETIPCVKNCSAHCALKPCGAVNDCVNEGDTYRCICQNGFSGDDCSVPPNFCSPNPCLNSGLCTSSESGFNCSCVKGYGGETCDIEPEDSLWGAWSGWSECSVSCGGGNQTRMRTCREGSDGTTCSGAAEELSKCGEDPCPECKELSRFYGTLKTCVEEDEVVTCTLTCAPGYLPANATHANADWYVAYQCSPYSNYQWNLTDANPTCSRPQRPQTFVAEAAMLLTPVATCGESYDLESNMSKLMSEVACQGGAPCQVQAVVASCTRRNRRQATDQGQITFTFTFDLTNVSQSVIDYWTLANASLSPIMTTGGGWLAVELDGIEFVADTNNVTDDGQVECSEGYFLQESFAACVGCSPGTWYDRKSGYCFSCPVGTYQELAAQYSCRSCPDGYTTTFAGSYDRKNCIYERTQKDSSDNSGIIIGVSVAVAAVALIIIIAFVVYKWKKTSSKAGASKEDTGREVTRERFESRTVRKDSYVDTEASDKKYSEYFSHGNVKMPLDSESPCTPMSVLNSSDVPLDFKQTEKL